MRIPHLKRIIFYTVLLGGCAFLIMDGWQAFFRAPSNPQLPVGMRVDEAVVAGELLVPLEKTVPQREAMKAELLALEKTDAPTFRPLYEKYLPTVGANGIADVLDSSFSECHEQSHDFGKVLYAKLHDLNAAMRACQHSCTEGCVHGVVMEYFYGNAPPEGADHAEVEGVESKMDDFCGGPSFQGAYSPYECAHGVGHVLTFLSDYTLDTAIASCQKFGGEQMQYYCATGTYMEYLTNREAADRAAGKSALYPCDTSPLPAACLSYKVPHLLAHASAGGGPKEVANLCKTLERELREDCFFGFGIGFMRQVAHGEVTLSDACAYGNMSDRQLCIEGLMQAMAIYFPSDSVRVCNELSAWRHPVQKHVCSQSISWQLHEMSVRAKPR